jgi:hypothetical protein
MKTGNHSQQNVGVLKGKIFHDHKGSFMDVLMNHHVLVFWVS